MAPEFRFALRCCLLVLLCATHGSLAIDPTAGQVSLSDDEWNNLAHNVVHQLYPQRENHYQFGFIVVGNLREVAESKELALERINTEGLLIKTAYSARTVVNPGPKFGPWVDNWNPEGVSPSNHNMYINYVTARPYDLNKDRKDPRRFRQHSEEFLLGELEYLYSQYNSLKGVPPDFVLLYTWFTPCNCCLSDIVKKRKARGAQHLKWIVAYSKVYTPHGTLAPDKAPMYTVSINACRSQFASNNIMFMNVDCKDLPKQHTRQQNDNAPMERRQLG